MYIKSYLQLLFTYFEFFAAKDAQAALKSSNKWLILPFTAHNVGSL